MATEGANAQHVSHWNTVIDEPLQAPLQLGGAKVAIKRGGRAMRETAGICAVTASATRTPTGEAVAAGAPHLGYAGPSRGAQGLLLTGVPSFREPHAQPEHE
mmetsp:Transcript_6957/g.21315  ORF Transcript_6957/g.21315 Transcript_6957/m.21315 type:complete len:102 (+) Transcript_6957:586-891(+)|eukprot:scaffold186148_cov27-Tisochrysis_lutea.AAC.3